ncbi:MAG: MBL fold metallo-hydrolase [Pseudomonadota bacterium]|nr:MBL fold metallo-hydrolase [Pseudomonadota bacterium]
MSLIFKQLFERESCTYTYLIADSKTKEAAIIDAVDIMIERDTALLKELELDLKFIIETHIHADHITSACPLKKYYPEARIVMGMENVAAEACSDIMAGEGHILNIGKYEITAIETPGHTLGCMSYLVENKVLTGDALFIRSTGRCDFQGGSAESLYESIQKLYKLPDSTEVYPAHDYNGLSVSTIGEEKKFNSMVRASDDQKTFIDNVNKLDLSLPKKIKVAVPANQSCGLILEKTSV